MVATSHKLQLACRVIFGDEVHISSDFVDYLQPSGLRDAYKRAAIQNHPDRAAQSDISEVVLAQRFKRVCESYELLKSYLDERSVLQPSRRELAQQVVSESVEPSSDSSQRSVLSFFRWFKN